MWWYERGGILGQRRMRMSRGEGLSRRGVGWCGGLVVIAGRGVSATTVVSRRKLSERRLRAFHRFCRFSASNGGKYDTICW